MKILVGTTYLCEMISHIKDITGSHFKILAVFQKYFIYYMHLKYVKIINKTASVMDRVLPRLITLLSIPLDPQARSYILKALRQTAAEKVKQKSPCLNPCLRQLETLLAELPHNATGTFNFQNIYFLC